MIRFNCPNCERPYELPDAFARLPLVCKGCGQRITPPAPSPEPPPAAPRAARPPEPAPVAPAVPPKPPAAKPAPAPNPPVPPPPPNPVFAARRPDDSLADDDVLVSKPDSTPDIDFNVGGPTATSLSDAARARPTGLSDPNRPRPADPEPTEPDSTLAALAKTAPLSDDERSVDRLQKINLDLLPPAPPAPPRPVPRPPDPPAPAPKSEPTLLPFVADLVVFVLLVLVGMVVGEVLARKPTGEVLSEAGSAAKFPPVDLLLWAAPPLVFGLVYLLLGSRERSAGAWLRRRSAARESSSPK